VDEIKIMSMIFDAAKSLRAEDIAAEVSFFTLVCRARKSDRLMGSIGRYDSSSDQELASGRQTFQLAVQGVGQGGSRGMLASRTLFSRMDMLPVVDVVVVEVDRTR
jgi:hypothetical protein